MTPLKVKGAMWKNLNEKYYKYLYVVAKAPSEIIECYTASRFVMIVNNTDAPLGAPTLPESANRCAGCAANWAD